MSERRRGYRFASEEHWRCCLLARFVPSDAGLVPSARFGTRAARVVSGAVSRVAVGPDRLPRWRQTRDDREVLYALDDSGSPAGPFDVDQALAASARWIVDHHWLWSLAADGRSLRRYDQRTLRPQRTVVLGDVGDATAGSPLRDVVPIDLASDGRDGVWLLVSAREGGERLVHLDCDACLRASVDVPCAIARAVQIGVLAGGATLALLEEGGRRLWLVDPSAAREPRALSIADVAPGWCVTRLATDGRNRLVLGGRRAAAGEGGWLLAVLDRDGELVDGPLAELFVGDGGGDCVDLAVRGDEIWFALSSGLWRLDASAACGARESESALLTPALLSPRIGSRRGWLRAEIDVELPRGALLEAEYVTTDDEGTMRSAAVVAGDRTRPAASRQRAVLGMLGGAAERRFSIAGPSPADVPISIPLFASQDRWLWLFLTLVVPPGVAPPTVRELRILYPDASLMEQLPAAYRDPKNDPGRVLRRIVGVLEATTQRIDDEIRDIGRAFHPSSAPDERLDELGRWLRLPWDAALPAEAKRCLLLHAGELLARRGTRAGLAQLLQCLVGRDGSATITDVTVDHPLARLGGDDRPGVRLPALLAGASPGIAIVGGGAALGRARLSCSPSDDDPLRDLAPTVRIELQVDAASRAGLEPLLRGVLAQYVPFGVRVAIAWRDGAAWSRGGMPVGAALDGHGPRRLGIGSSIGRVVVAGPATPRVDEHGLDLGFRLT